jgi:hypothetical protein
MEERQFIHWYQSENGRASIDHLVSLGSQLGALWGWWDFGQDGQAEIEIAIDDQRCALVDVIAVERPDVHQLYQQDGLPPDTVFGFIGLVQLPEAKLHDTAVANVSITTGAATAEFRVPLEPIKFTLEIPHLLDSLLSRLDPRPDMLVRFDAGILSRHYRAIAKSRPLALHDLDYLIGAANRSEALSIVEKLLESEISRLLRLPRRNIGSGEIEVLDRYMAQASAAGQVTEHLGGIYCQLLFHVGEPSRARNFVLPLLLEARNPADFTLRYLGPRIRDTFWLPEADDIGAEDCSGLAQALGRLHESALFLRSVDENDLAQLFFVGSAIQSDSQRHLLNAGLACLEGNDVATAASFFDRVDRINDRAIQPIIWPKHEGHSWPSAGWDYRPIDDDPRYDAEWPRISVVIPSLNQGRYLEQTLLSLLNQGYPNLQIIVIDGGSTDESVSVLERYRDRCDVVVIEPDECQSEAINKGFGYADGELLSWLNSDDMLAPGALHMVARAWLKTRADLIAGICLEHSDRRVKHVNKPKLKRHALTQGLLAEVFAEWFQGRFFYQPEVFFSRQMFERAGAHLDETLHYAMDYDLWMRFADLKATVELIPWPVAYFRIHDGQKTYQLDDSIEEQCRIRSRYVDVQPPYGRLLQIQGKLQGLRSLPRPVVAIITSRMSQLFPDELVAETRRRLAPRVHLLFESSVTETVAGTADAIISLVHLSHEADSIRQLPTGRPHPLILGWLWNNHHRLADNHEIAQLLDIVVPMHGEYVEYLRNDRAIQWDPALPCVTQWTRSEAGEHSANARRVERESRLHGCFVDQPQATGRDRFLLQSMEALVDDSALSVLPESTMNAHFARPSAERFMEYCGYKASLVLPLKRELPHDVFDALLTGQIPLVPDDMGDFDRVIPPALQALLPIFRYRVGDTASLLEAHGQAVEAFDREGETGTDRRHRFALENHLFDNRIEQLLERLLADPAVAGTASSTEHRPIVEDATAAVAAPLEPEAPEVASPG